jgi:Fe-S cluster assembly ATP-binding protein
MLEIKGLTAEVDGKPILKGIDLVVPQGEVHAIMGPNGSGKSTLSYVLSGRDGYEVTGGTALLHGQDLLAMEPEDRAKGESELDAMQFLKLARERMKALSMNDEMLKRGVNVGFSGGEKKRNEILQMALLQPKLAILDETDSGLDIDALKIVADGVNAMRGPDFSALVITHYQRLLDYIVPDRVHVLMGGRIVRSGGPELAKELEAQGYGAIQAAA